MKKLTNKKCTAFTLAETLIALVILGIIAAVTIPTLIRNHVDNANRAKVKKAMTMYEKALNNMIIGNDLRSTDAITNFGQETLNDVECGKTRPYFKSVEDGVVGENASNCRFKTADGVWWDITDITNPIIILKSDYKAYPLTGDGDNALQTLAQGTDKFVYGMVGRYEDDKGILRINDNAYEDQHGSEAQKAEVAKLWDFINNQTSGGNAGGGEQGGGDKPTYAFGNCAVTDDTHCMIGKTSYKKVTPASDTCASKHPDADDLPSEMVCQSEAFYIMDNYVTSSELEEYATQCSLIESSDACEAIGNDYWAAAKYYCEQQG